MHTTKRFVMFLLDFGMSRKERFVQCSMKSLMLRNAKGEMVSNASIDTSGEKDYELPFAQHVALVSDGLNEKKTIWRNVDNHNISLGLPGLTPFLPCTLQNEHSAF
ncbi:hypothetical protein DPMN_097618 [Dreissena polymorpha]|uniref:Uncharacterized protein n=1 Tax=Dreissena polymorpha TaxID=45954 RepID=A0A9D4R5J9_DREPO|nr:hypothetical protein DPMN_097618 [Dreissena polymorpha]